MIQICIICIRLFDNSQGQIIENLFQSFKDFSEIFSQSYSLLLPDSFNNIIKILSIENSILETIPNASNFLQLIDLIFYQCFQQSDTIIQKDSSNAVFALFSNKSFRKAFINSGKYAETVMALINYSNPQLTNYFYDFFLNYLTFVLAFFFVNPILILIFVNKF